MQTLLIAAAAFLGLLVALRLALPKLVPLFVFHPEPLRPRESRPRYWGYPEAREVRFPTSDNLSLHGWWFPAAGPTERRGTAIFFHGNAGHIGPRGEIGAGLSRLGFDVLLPDYRGYGLSEGKPSEQGLYRDAEAAYVYALRRSGDSAETLLVVGNSLGSAVAAELAARRPVGGVVLVGPFTHTPAVARRRFRWLPPWVLEWESHRFDTLARVADVRAPVLVAVGSEDRVIPRGQARRVFEAASEPKAWLEADGVGHNDVFSHRGLWMAIHQFAAVALARPSI